MADPMAGVIAAFNRQLQAATDTTRGLQAQLTSFAAATAKTTAALAALGAAGLEGGFTVLRQSVQYLTSVIASVAVPVFGVLAATVLTVADTLQVPLRNAAEKLAQTLAGELQPASGSLAETFGVLWNAVRSLVVLFEAGFKSLRSAIEQFVDYVAGLIVPGGPTAQEAFGRFLRDVEQAGGEAQQRLGGIWNPAAPGAAGGAGAAPGGGGGGFMDKFIDNFQTVIQGLRQELGAQGNVGFASLTEIGKQVQAQAFQSDLQKKQLDQHIKAVGILEKMLAEMRQKQAPAVGR